MSAINGRQHEAPRRPVQQLDNVERLLNQVQEANQVTSKLDTEAKPFEALNLAAGGYREILLDLSSGTFLHKFSGRAAYGLVILQEGSVPGARLDFDFQGAGKLTNQPPDTFLPIQFDSLEISRGSRSATVGNVRVLVFESFKAALDRPRSPVAAPAPTYLLGSSTAFSAIQGENALPATHSLSFSSQTGNFTEGLTVTGGTSGATGVIVSQVDSGTSGTLYLSAVTGTFQAAETITDTSTGSAAAGGAQSAISAGAAPTSFEVTGWKRVTLLVDTVTGGTNATSFNLVPWFYDPDLGAWLDQTLAMITVPDSTTTLQRYRVVQLDLTGLRGRLFLQINSLLAAARTGLAFKAIGVE